MDRSWSKPETVRGFAEAPPNTILLQFAERERCRVGPAWALDVGCGAGRNSVPIARLGWCVAGIDLSVAMLAAAAARATAHGLRSQCQMAVATMQAIPIRTAQCDLIIAHGVWNLARSDHEFRCAVREAARVGKPGAGLFVFTFSRHTLPADARPVPGETFVFTQFSGEPQCFLTAEQLVSELAQAGFVADPGVPLDELNRTVPGTLLTRAGPVIYEAAFRLQ